MLLFLLYLLALLAIVVVGIAMTTWSGWWDRFGLIPWMVSLIAVWALMFSFVIGSAVEDTDRTVETAAEYAVWKVSCPYGTFTATDEGVVYSPDSCDDYAVVYIDNGTMAQITVGSGNSQLTVVVSEGGELGLTVKTLDRWNLLGAEMLSWGSEYIISIPDPRMVSE